MTAIRATVNPPTPGTMWATNDPIPAARLTIARVLVRLPAPAGVYIGPSGPGGTEVDGAACCPAICVGLLDEGGRSLGMLLIPVKFRGRRLGSATNSGGWALGRGRRRRRHSARR